MTTTDAGETPHLLRRLGSPWLRREMIAHPVEWSYLGLALVFGLILLVVVPPFQTNDGPEHYFRSWAVAEGQVFVDRGAVVELPSNVAWLFADLQAIEVTQGKARYDSGRTLSRLRDKVSSDRSEQTTLTGSYSPIGYLPQALGINVVRVFGGSPLLALYAARLGMLLTCTALVFLALRLIPFGAPVLALIALLPMSMTLTASLNPGAILNAGAALWIALVLRAANQSHLRPRAYMLLCLVAILLLTVKPGYFALALLILLVPRRRYASTRQYAAVAACCIVGAIAVNALLVLAAPTAPQDVLLARGIPAGIDASTQLRFVVAHPWAFTQVITDSVGVDALGWTKEFVGAPGRGSVILSDIVTLVALLGGLLLMMRSATRQIQLARWQRAGSIATAGLTALTIIGAFYVIGTPVASGEILGLQGRYFLPIVPSFFIGLYGLRMERRRWLVAVLSICVLLMAAMTVAALLRHYYAP